MATHSGIAAYRNIAKSQGMATTTKFAAHAA